MAKTTDPDIYKLPPPEPLKVTEEGLEESVRIPKFEKEILTKDFEVKVKIQLIITTAWFVLSILESLYLAGRRGISKHSYRSTLFD